MTKIKIGLFGFGVVGQGIYEVVRKSKNAHAEIVKICVRDPKKPRKIEVDPSLFTTSVDDILDNQNINLVVEVIDDADAAYNIVKRAMLRGIPVVTVVNGTESRALSDPVCFARTPYHSLFLGRADRKFQQRGGLHENSVQFHQTVRARSTVSIR